MTVTNNTSLRDELEIRRRHVLDEIERIADSWLCGRLNWRRRLELIDHIERVLVDADQDVLRELARR
jgi:hypothetical protein